MITIIPVGTGGGSVYVPVWYLALAGIVALSVAAIRFIQEDPDDILDVVIALYVGVISGIIWPLTLAGFGVYYVVRTAQDAYNKSHPTKTRPLDFSPRINDDEQ